MISRDLKVAYYFFVRLPMKINGCVYRWLFSPKKGKVKVHLGPGQKNYLEGWINVDANFLTAKIDVWADLRDRLPFENETVDAFYSHHMIEHLPDQLLLFHLGEMFRCLKQGGVIRIGGPNGDVAIERFIHNDLKWFSDFPDPHASIGGKFVNFVFCRGEHLTLLTESYLRELLGKTGFSHIQKCLPKEMTNYPEMFDQLVMDKEFIQPLKEYPNTIIVKAIKESVPHPMVRL